MAIRHDPTVLPPVVLMCIIPYFVSVFSAGIDHSDVLVELPVTIRNSRLINSLLCELDVRDTEPYKIDLMGLSARLGTQCV